MRSVVIRICVAAGVASALSAAAAQAQEHFLRAGFDRTATLLNGGSEVGTSGPLGECPQGDHVLLLVRFIQGKTTAKGQWPKPHPCSGRDRRWTLTATTGGGSRFAPGRATGHGTVVLERDGRTVNTIRWQRTITLRKGA